MSNRNPSLPSAIQRTGDVLIFPELCAATGAPSESLIRRSEKLLLIPYWSMVLIPLGLLPFLVAFVLTRREQKVVYYLSPAGNKAILLRRALVGILFAAGFATLFVGGATSKGWIFLIAFALLGLSAVGYRKVFFPFQYKANKEKQIIVYQLPEPFDDISQRPASTPPPLPGV